MTSRITFLKGCFALIFSLFLTQPARVQAGPSRPLHGHLPPPAALTQPAGPLAGSELLQLAISLPLRNTDALSNLLQRLYDPASPDYHHYLTPAQFTEQFGPTAADYQKVIQFAQSNGFKIINRRDSRMLLDVKGTAATVENAFHVHLGRYQHPSESRQFYAPDVEPTIDAALPILDVRGLDSFASAHSMLRVKKMSGPAVPAAGSGTNGYYQGSDFRNAYAPGVTLNGTGQTVGLLELDAYYSNDIVTYESLAGLPNVPLININVTNALTVPSDGVVEVSLDIEMAIAMAPQLSAVYVFEAGGSDVVGDFQDIVDSMASSNQIKQFSSSWAYTGGTGPNTNLDFWFQKMQTQGQSFYQASGDGNAWVFPIATPNDSPYIISVGGTSLAMTTNGGAYQSETVWNEGNQGRNNGWSPNEGSGKHQNDYIGSSGGVSGVYPIPPWQTSAINSTNKGSTNARNIPDVAMTASNIFVVASNGWGWVVGGTSCAAPLWAGFTALMNQQAASAGVSPVGFINPAIYALGQSPSYSNLFHDITVGNNTNNLSTNNYKATAGYDLCTGWGSPNGMALINALVPVSFQVIPATGFAAAGPYSGPFTPTNQTFILTNGSTSSVGWNLVNTSSWMSISLTNGVLAASAATSINIGLTPSAAALDAGAYTNTMLLSNTAAATTQPLVFSLTISRAAPGLAWTAPGGVIYGTSLNGVQLDATAAVAGGFVYSPTNGSVLTAGSHTLSVTFTPTNAVDYTSASSNVTISVAAAPLSVTAANASRAYGATNPVFTGTIVGLANGDNITATYATTAASNSPVGNYAIVPTLVDPNNRRTNYSVTSSNGTLTVYQAPAMVTWSAPTPITYGTALGGNQLNASANTAGAFAYTPAAGTVLNTGTNRLSVLFSPTDSTDFSNANASVNLTVNPALLTVVASNASQTYGQPLPVFGGMITGVTNGDNITASFTTTATSNSPVGTYPIISTLVDPNNRETNYTVVLSNGIFTITPATPVVNWATPAPITYGTPLDTNQLNASANVPGNFVYTPPAGTVPSTGTNQLSVLFSPTDSMDFSNANASVNLAVNPAALTVIASNASQIYGQPLPVFGGTITGVTNGDNITASFTTTATNNSPVGTYSIVATLIDPDDQGTNYSVVLSNGDFTITPAMPVLNWATPAPITYGTPLDTNQLDATASVPGNFIYTPAAGAIVGPGTNGLSVLFTPNDTTNYTSATISAELDVMLVPIPLNIQVVNNNIILTWNDPLSVFSLQAAPSVTGGFTNIPGASSPYTNSLSAVQQFFQLSAPSQ